MLPDMWIKIGAFLSEYRRYLHQWMGRIKLPTDLFRRANITIEQTVQISL